MNTSFSSHKVIGVYTKPSRGNELHHQILDALKLFGGPLNRA